MKHISFWILSTLLNFDTLMSHNGSTLKSTLNCDQGKFLTQVTIPHGIMPSITIQHVLMTQGHNATLNHDQRSQFQLQSCHRSQFNMCLWPKVTMLRWIMTRSHNSTWNHALDHNSTGDYDPGSQCYVESWPGVIIHRGIMTCLSSKTAKIYAVRSEEYGKR